MINKTQGRGGSTCSHLPILFTGILFATNLFADNAVFNGSFDMVPWDSGWTKSVYFNTHNEKWISFSKTITSDSGMSPPNSCIIGASAGINPPPSDSSSSIFLQKEIFQYFPPVSNCIFKVWIYGNLSAFNGTAGDSIQLFINGKWTSVWKFNSGQALSYLTWTEFCDTIESVVSGVKFKAWSMAYSEVDVLPAGVNNYFFLDDFSITQIGIEERQFPVNSGQWSVNIIKDKIYLSVPNSSSPNNYYPNTLITIYDLTGRPKETVYFGTLTKGNYTFTPNIHKSGIYFVRLTAVCHSERSEESNIITETKKLILVK